MRRANVLVAAVWVVSGGVGVCLGPGSGKVRLCYVCVCCESGFFVYMAGPGICILCYGDTCASILRCTKCSILLHLTDIYFLSYSCIWKISQIQTCLSVVVGPGSPSIRRSSASQQAAPHGRLA